MWVDGDYTNPAVPKTSWWNQVLDGVGTFKEGHHEQPLAKDFRMLFFNNAPCSLIVLPEESLFVLTKTKLMWTTCIFIQQVTIRQIHPEIWWLVNLPLAYLHPQKYSSRPYDIRAYENHCFPLIRPASTGFPEVGAPVGAPGWPVPMQVKLGSFGVKGDDLENVCYLREDVPKWDGELGEQWLGPWYALVVFFSPIFFWGFFSSIFVGGEFFMCFPIFSCWKADLNLGLFGSLFFFWKERKGIAPSYL